MAIIGGRFSEFGGKTITWPPPGAESKTVEAQADDAAKTTKLTIVTGTIDRGDRFRRLLEESRFIIRVDMVLRAWHARGAQAVEEPGRPGQRRLQRYAVEQDEQIGMAR